MEQCDVCGNYLVEYADCSHGHCVNCDDDVCPDCTNPLAELAALGGMPGDDGPEGGGSIRA